MLAKSYLDFDQKVTPTETSAATLANGVTTVKAKVTLAVVFSTFFDPNQSFVFQPNRRPASTLTHEKIHIAIVAYMAEKANDNLPDIVGEATASDADPARAKAAAIAAARVKADTMLAKYTSDIVDINRIISVKNYDGKLKGEHGTNHGIYVERQNEWVRDYEKFCQKVLDQKGFTK